MNGPVEREQCRRNQPAGDDTPLLKNISRLTKVEDVKSPNEIKLMCLAKIVEMKVTVVNVQ